MLLAYEIRRICETKTTQYEAVGTLNIFYVKNLTLFIKI